MVLVCERHKVLIVTPLTCRVSKPVAAGVRIVPDWDSSRRLSIILDEELFSSAKSRATGPQRSPVPLNLFVAEEEREQDIVFLILSFNCNKS